MKLLGFGQLGVALLAPRATEVGAMQRSSRRFSMTCISSISLELKMRLEKLFRESCVSLECPEASE